MECGGLAAAELKKNEEETDGNDETESDDGLSGGEGNALEGGEFAAEIDAGAANCSVGWSTK